jgi:hypothetical protein
MQRTFALAATSLALAAAASHADTPSARALYVERRGLIEVDTRCHLFAPEVRAALQVTAMQARGTLLRGGWSTAQMDQLEQATVDAAHARACNDQRTTSAAATARQAYNSTFRSNTMEFPGWARTWSARRVADSDGWRLRQSISSPVPATFGVRQLSGEQFAIVVPVSDEGDAPASAQLELRNPNLPAGALDLSSRIAGGLEAGAPGPANSMTIGASARLVEHPGWFQTQIVFVFPNAAFRMLCQLDPRESVAINLNGPHGPQRLLVEVGDVAAAAGFLATRAD